MKRLIKYWSSYEDTQFSDCSTSYEVLPVLVDDSAGADDLKALAKGLGFRNRSLVTVPKGKGHSSRPNSITHSLKLSEVKAKPSAWGNKKEKISVYLGFITLTKNKRDNEILPLQNGIDKRITKAQAYEIVNSQAFGVSDVGELDGEGLIVMQSWNYYHEMRLQGYSLESFQKRHGVSKDKGCLAFDDSVSRCGECDKYDHNDDTYASNFRVVEFDLIGINCGCFKEVCKAKIESFIDDVDVPMNLDAAEELQDEGKLEFVERFIGGMVDGRGGSYGGERTREGTPVKVLEEYKAKFPKAKFVFTHDESGQFQTYFSIWKVKRNVKQKSVRGEG